MLAIFLVAACGSSSPEPSDTDAGAVIPADAQANDEGCQPETLEADCPPRSCEVATGCSAGECVYGAFVCGQPDQVCPVEACRANEVEDGIFSNECIVVEAAPCGDGASCVGDACVVPVTGLSLEGSLENANIHQTIGGLTLDAELSYGRERMAPQFSSQGLRLTGGLQN
jgi:hypothetical protein|tara:strand:- start:43 stop:552 length:510 start_codon:yes stop_codon:yes gene_type:complete